MFLQAILLLCIAASFAEKPPQGSELCHEVLLRDCTGFEDEVVCGSDGVTYHNRSNHAINSSQ
ncbi:hypothetical protein KUTeg_015074 [Tegillarca granosa]|uniref:Kazal-like domain-containing protein n=1 Tax=Tegillarca granosa TaxID=220873 RepID=A0ABQ9EUA6_TEGGR|nr:hypothetical protein KUTeg_015074 [Tegillarca granosa]